MEEDARGIELPLQSKRDLGYTVIEEGEPHAHRMHAMLEKHPEIEELYGYDRSTAVICVAITAFQILMAYGVAATDTWMSTWWGFFVVAFLVGGPINHWCAMGIHEASHNLAAKTEWGNRAVALVCNIPLVVPSAMSFCRYHLWHHIYLGVPGKDNDLPMEFEVKYISTTGVGKMLWIVAYVFFATCCRGFLNKPRRWEVINIFIQVPIMVALYLWLGPVAILYLFASLILGMGLHPVAGHWLHEHYLFEGDQETYSYYGPLNMLTFNVGYHNEHHDFMRVPGRKLPELHRIGREFYGEQLKGHGSWAGIMWRFVTDPSLGHQSRILRTMETFKLARLDRKKQREHSKGKAKPHLAQHGV